MNAKQNLILIGMPGAGKSTIGVLLAKRLGTAFLDTDILIQTGERSYLQDIISRHGISGFREIEETYTANCHNLQFWTPTPTLPRWEREHKESADYARLQYICSAYRRTAVWLPPEAALFTVRKP